MGTKRAEWEGVPTITNYEETEPYGGALEIGGNSIRARWTVPNNDYDWVNATTPGMTAACLIRPDLPGSVDATKRPFYKKRNGNEANADGGWALITGAGNTWGFQIADGVNAPTEVFSTTTQNSARNHFLLGRLDATNIEIWVNGKLEGTTAHAGRFPANNNQPIRIFGFGAANLPYDGVIGMVAMWDRTLSNGEVQRLSADPFILWRHLAPIEIPGLASETFAPGRIDMANTVRMAPGTPFAAFAPGGVMQGCCCCPSSVVLF